MQIEKLDETIEAIEEVIMSQAQESKKIDSEAVSALASLIQARTLCGE